ncbi:MAG: ATP-binding protein [Pseudomonadota bacterium]
MSGPGGKPLREAQKPMEQVATKPRRKSGGRGMLDRIKRSLHLGWSSLAFLAGSTSFGLAETSTISIPLLTGPGGASFQIVMFAIFSGAVSFALLAATWLIKERRKVAVDHAELTSAHFDLKARNERLEALVEANDQRTVIWNGRDEQPTILGSLPLSSGAPNEDAAFIGFGKWMKPESAAAFDHAADRLRKNAEAFDLTIETQRSVVLEVQGRTSGGMAFVRFVSLQGERAALAKLQSEHKSLANQFDILRALHLAFPFPAWMRDANGKLAWVNNAYATAVDAENDEAARQNQIELLDTGSRQIAHSLQQEGRPYVQRAPVTVSGDRRLMQIVDISTPEGGAGVAIDLSEIDLVQATLKKTIEAHAQTLDNLATAVAIFDGSKHLKFYNSAFQRLWGLDPAFLDEEPDFSSVMEKLRETRKLEERADFRKWVAGLAAVHMAVEPDMHDWHLPDGKALRVVANPHSQGGVTWVYEDVSEMLALESSYNAMSQVQSVTLDHLAEAVIVFGSDGKLKLFNPPLQSIWRLLAEDLAEGTHVSEFIRICRPLTANGDEWDVVQRQITGSAEQRETVSGRFEQNGNNVIDYALVPLPNGQFMITFVDVTDSVEIEKALKERNVALEAAHRIKSAFVEHVSYELRTPLTNIIGFSEMLENPDIGSLNSTQKDYLNNILHSSSVLLSIVNNILDLASIDAGTVDLEFETVSVQEIVSAAEESVKDHVTGRSLRLDIEVPADAGEFRVDEKRVRQILFNLLTNSVKFTPDGGWISLICEPSEEAVTFRLADSGPGISKEERDQIFGRFESKSKGNTRGGAGLGLSIVQSFVDLHGGEIAFDESVKQGTTIVMTLPRNPQAAEKAA